MKEEDDEYTEWWVYVLLSEANGQTYVGVTVDVERRLRQHNGEIVGGAKRTHRGRPWKLAKKHGPLLDRSEAQTIEYELKSRRGKERLTWKP
jgi:putative endonuclease